MEWLPFVLFNTGLIVGIGSILWYKFHKLRLSMEREFDLIRAAAPPILVGEAFIGERFERLEQHIRELTVRIEELEALLVANGGAHSPELGT
jgi:hypothetical protein